MKRYLETGEARVIGRRIEITGMRSDGSEFPVELAIVRVPIAGPPFFTAYLRDLTERKKLESEQAFLLRASEQLASSLDYETTIASIAQLAVPALADWCAVDVVERDQSTKHVAVAHADPAKVEYVKRLREKYPADPNSPRGAAQVIRTGKPELLSDIPESMIAQAARDEEHLQILRKLGLKSYLAVPLRARGTTFGALTLVYAESGRRFEERDLKVATELARRIGTAIENARLLQESEEARHELEQQAAEMEIQAMEMEETQHQMELTNAELHTVNTRLKEKTAEVRHALKEAEDANRAKSDFLATMSHELRTPLNAISGYAELLKMGIRGPINEAQRADLDRINRSQAHLLGIINDILKFAKLESGQLEVKMEDFRVGDAVRAAEELVKPQLDARRIQYQLSAGDEGVTVRSDRERFQQIILNLLGNAAKFTPEGRSVTVGWEQKGDKVLTHVTDTGIGIPADQLDRIFDPFVQVDASTTRQSEGVGLGLAIGRDLARQMGGDVTVSSQLGQGSTFTLTLPRGA
jgi:signal transduction histidine kinase